MTESTKITLEDFSFSSGLHVKAMVFRDSPESPNCRIWCQSLDYYQSHRNEWQERYAPNGQIDFIYGIDIGSSCKGKAFWLVYGADCYSPPCYVVLGGSELGSEEIDIAVDSFKGLQWDFEDIKRNFAEPTDTHVDQLNERIHKAIDDGIIGIADGGLYYDSESIQACRVVLTDIIMGE